MLTELLRCSRFLGANPLLAPAQFLLWVPITGKEDFDPKIYTCGSLKVKGLYDLIEDKGVRFRQVWENKGK